MFLLSRITNCTGGWAVGCGQPPLVEVTSVVGAGAGRVGGAGQGTLVSWSDLRLRSRGKEEVEEEEAASSTHFLLRSSGDS